MHDTLHDIIYNKVIYLNLRGAIPRFALAALNPLPVFDFNLK